MEIAVGTKVVVTYIVETELETTTGTTGTIIARRERARIPEKRRAWSLHTPSVYVLVKFERGKGMKLEGPEEGVIPIELMERTFRVKLPLRGQTSVHWRQLPRTAAYPSTDCEAQGQTLERVIVLIAFSR